MSDVRRLGREAEDRAADHLLGLGYTVVTRRYRARHGEIDLIALDAETLVFVEVKWRHGRTAEPEEGVNPAKIRHFEAAVRDYLRQTGEWHRPVRYDIIAITPGALRHHVDAFRGSPVTFGGDDPEPGDEAGILPDDAGL